MPAGQAVETLIAIGSSYGEQARLNAITYSESHSAGGGSSASGTDSRTYDIVGNLIADADYLYQYDAWNRLIEVRVRDAFDLAVFTEMGQYPAVPPPDKQTGRIVARHRYDALARMVTRHTLINGAEDEYGMATEHH